MRRADIPQFLPDIKGVCKMKNSHAQNSRVLHFAIVLILVSLLLPFDVHCQVSVQPSGASPDFVRGPEVLPQQRLEPGMTIDGKPAPNQLMHPNSGTGPLQGVYKPQRTRKMAYGTFSKQKNDGHVTGTLKTPAASQPQTTETAPIKKKQKKQKSLKTVNDAGIKNEGEGVR